MQKQVDDSWKISDQVMPRPAAFVCSESSHSSRRISEKVKFWPIFIGRLDPEHRERLEQARGLQGTGIDRLEASSSASFATIALASASSPRQRHHRLCRSDAASAPISSMTINFHECRDRTARRHKIVHERLWAPASGCNCPTGADSRVVLGCEGVRICVRVRRSSMLFGIGGRSDDHSFPGKPDDCASEWRTGGRRREQAARHRQNSDDFRSGRIGDTA